MATRTVETYDRGVLVASTTITIADADADDDAATAFIKARFPAAVAKAKAIMADPGNAPDFTAAETKVIKALCVLDLAKRYR